MKKLLTVLLVLSISLVSGLGYFFFQDNSISVETNFIGILNVEGPIISSEAVSYYSNLINKAITDNSIKGVVLRVDSPGGYAHYVEQLYLDLVELNHFKPLTTSIVTALSGGYYLSVSSDYIYVHPTSSVGNIGVIGTSPPTLVPSESVLESGVYKITGNSKLLFPFNLSSALDNFASAVEKSRGMKLKLTSRELRRGMIYLGSDSIRFGLADELGSLQKAVQKTASTANLKTFQILNLNEYYQEEASTTFNNVSNVVWRNLTVNILNSIHPPPAMFYIYLPATGIQRGIYSVSSQNENDTINVKNSNGDVLVDLSHGNKFSPWELEILMAELAINGITLGFISEWNKLASELNTKASCLIIASPTETYSQDEIKQIKAFVGVGGTLLLFSDPASEYLDNTQLHGPINSVANNFGISFASGYLYNEVEHFGYYRNILIENFEESNLTRSLSSIVFFTASNIHSKNALTHTSEGTFSSTAEKTDDYSPIAMETFNGSVIAFGDFTFLKEPYCYVEDNYLLIKNLVQMIQNVNVTEVLKPVQNSEGYKIDEPSIAIGTEKLFSEDINGEIHSMRWVKVSESEVLIERPDRISTYYFDKNGSLTGWVSDEMSAWYNPHIPKPPYPLAFGDKWSYSSNYNLTIENDKIHGEVIGEEEVVDFVEINAYDNNLYFCVVISSTIEDTIESSESTIKIISTSYSWISQEVGLVKEESTIQTFVNGFPVDTENRIKILTNVS